VIVLLTTCDFLKALGQNNQRTVSAEKIKQLPSIGQSVVLPIRDDEMNDERHTEDQKAQQLQHGAQEGRCDEASTTHQQHCQPSQAN